MESLFSGRIPVPISYLFSEEGSFGCKALCCKDNTIRYDLRLANGTLTTIEDKPLL